MRSLLQVDYGIYNFFRDQMRGAWSAAVANDPTIEDDLTTLQCINTQLKAGCMHAIGPTCHIAYQKDSAQYTRALHDHHGWAN